MFEVISGNIVAAVKYQVIGGTSIVYNSVTVHAGDFFIGVSEISDYTKTAGSEIVTFASDISQTVIEIEQKTFEGIFPDSSNLNQTVNELGDTVFYFEEYTAEDFTQDGKNFIPAETKIFVPLIVPEITEIIGNVLYEGVTYAELIALEEAYPEISLGYAGPHNISKIIINGIIVFPVVQF